VTEQFLAAVVIEDVIQDVIGVVAPSRATLKDSRGETGPLSERESGPVDSGSVLWTCA
jgi:hypothetical protein